MQAPFGKPRFAAALCGLVLLGAAPPPEPLYGFSAASSAREHRDELRFLDLPSAAGALADADVIGAHPHYAGTPADHALAVFTRDKLREYGFDARIETFTARVETPLRLSLELYADGRVAPPVTHRRPRQPRFVPAGLDLREAGDPVDPPTLDPAIGLPFNAGSADGDVTAPLVYARRGLAEDYATLAGAGVDVRGAVVLVRYGGAFRGLLAQRAQEAGAAGVVFYDDPADDGAGRGPVYPNGPWRPATSVQRGSLGAGIRIPVLPVSAENARTLLASLRGPAGPSGWGGALDAAYPLGKGPSVVRLVVRLKRATTTLWNTVGTLPGAAPGETVVAGAHRDAWVYGVGDNGAGVITMLEAARGLGYLAHSGWKPRRSIVIALWDGEELGLLGSAAYAKEHAAELRRGCIAYLNADQDLTGQRIVASASGALAPAIVEATRAVTDPARVTATIYDRWLLQRPGVAVESPGGGSDHESFMTAFGTPVAELGFSGPFGPYHSSFDTVRYATTWSDPEFALHRTNAQLYGVLAMRLAAADAVPYHFSSYIAPLRSGLLRLEARAERDHRSLDASALRSALENFASAARRADERTATGSGPSGALAAAQDVDTLAYGTNGYAAVAYPEVDAAYASGEAGRLSAALGNAAAAVTRATDALR